MAQDTLARVLSLKAIASGGSGGSSDYSDLENKPKINGVELAGDKSLEDLGITAGNGIKIENGVISLDLQTAEGVSF